MRNNTSQGGRGRGYGRGGGRGRGNSRYSNNRSKQSSKTQLPKERKSLADYRFTIGTATQQSDFPTVAEYLINYIRKTYVHGDHIAIALEQRKEYEFEEPEFVPPANKNMQKSAEIKFESRMRKYDDRVEQYQINRVSTWKPIHS